jgi:hypothetical protein
MSTLAELHASAVAAILARPVPPCAECGTPMMHAEGIEHGIHGPKDIFTEVAADGTAYGPAVDLAPLFDPAANWLGMSNPYAYLARLGDLCSEATSAKRAETTWLYERTIREYVSLKVRLDTGGYHHPHMPKRDLWVYDPNRVPVGERECVYHCGSPAWLRPSGWYCRECRDLLTGATAEVRMVPVYADEVKPARQDPPRATGAYGNWPANPAPVKRLPPECDVCSRRDGPVTKVPQFGNRLACEPCIEEAKAAGVLPAA